MLQDKCRVLQDKEKNYYVHCGSVGEKGKTKNRKGSSSPGENKKRPSGSKVRKNKITVFFILEGFESSSDHKIQLILGLDAILEKWN